jgi:hypothetical protein
MGNTTLLLISMQIPHSSSLSNSISESFPFSDSPFLLYLVAQVSLCFLSSTSVIPLWSCIKEGNITPVLQEPKWFKKKNGLPDSWNSSENTYTHWTKQKSRAFQLFRNLTEKNSIPLEPSYRRTLLEWLSFHEYTWLSSHLDKPVTNLILSHPWRDKGTMFDTIRLKGKTLKRAERKIRNCN